MKNKKHQNHLVTAGLFDRISSEHDGQTVVARKTRQANYGILVTTFLVLMLSNCVKYRINVSTIPEKEVEVYLNGVPKGKTDTTGTFKFEKGIIASQTTVYTLPSYPSPEANRGILSCTRRTFCSR